MPRIPKLSAVPLFITYTLIASCGSSASPAAVKVSLSAPVDGATVVVPGIVVLGTIEPKTAVVTVSGKPARVAGGTFRRDITLRKRRTRIAIVASARGYTRSTIVVFVTYVSNPRSARAHAGIAIGKRSQPRPAPGGVASAGSSLPPGAEATFVTGCSESGGSEAGCTCVWRELEKRGFNSTRAWAALVRGWRRSFLSSGVIAFPPVLKGAMMSCAAEFGQTS
jgi:hypothetical protein